MLEFFMRTIDPSLQIAAAPSLKGS